MKRNESAFLCLVALALSALIVQTLWLRGVVVVGKSGVPSTRSKRAEPSNRLAIVGTTRALSDKFQFLVVRSWLLAGAEVLVFVDTNVNVTIPPWVLKGVPSSSSIRVLNTPEPKSSRGIPTISGLLTASE